MARLDLQSMLRTGTMAKMTEEILDASTRYQHSLKTTPPSNPPPSSALGGCATANAEER